MAANPMPFSHPADPSDVHGTGWNQDLAGQGKHGQRQWQRAPRRSQPAPLPQPEEVVIVPRGHAFEQGVMSSAIAQRATTSVGAKIAGAAIGAVIGAKVYDHLKNRKR